MSLVPLKQRWSELYSSLFTEGFVDAQFREIADVQYDPNPNFAIDAVNTFYQECEIIINDLTVLLLRNPLTVDSQMVHAHVHKFMRTCFSFGARRLKDICLEIKSINDPSDREGYLRQLLLMKKEYHLLKSKLQTILNLEQQILAYDDSVPLPLVFF